MKIKGIVMEDFINYKKPSMFILFPYCDWKCEKEAGVRCCQNSELSKSPIIEVDVQTIVDKYLNNPITSAVVCGGLEPFDSWEDLHLLITKLREKTDDDIVIYTGYKEFDNDEFDNHIETLACLYKNIVVKFGKFLPNQQPHYDKVLGVMLASDNQYAERIS